MEGYNAFPYTSGYPGMRPGDAQYQDHGDGFGDYYAMDPLDGDGRRRSRSKRRSRRTRSRSLSRTDSKTRSRSRSKSLSLTRTHSKSRSKSRSRSRSHTRSRSRSRSGTRRELNLKEPTFLDAFRVLYLTSSSHKKNGAMFLATKKRQDRVEEYLKSDGLGSKRWLFYPRNGMKSEPAIDTSRSESRGTCDQRVKVDGDFFRKYKRSRKVDADAPINKLKRWELLFYKKLGFIQAL